MANYVDARGKLIEDATDIAGENIIHNGLPVSASNPLPIAGTFSAEPPVGGATEAKQDVVIARLPAALGVNGGLKVSIVDGSAGQIYFEGTVTITRPAGALTYTAGNALYSSATPGAAPSAILSVPGGSAITAASTIVITGISIHASTASPTVLPLMDLVCSPVTFTSMADNAAFAPPAARLQDGVILTSDFGILCGTTGAICWNYDMTARLKLAAGSSTVYIQPRFRTAYVSAGADVFVFKISGFVV